jgi:osmoprotectant transport system permease protein
MPFVEFIARRGDQILQHTGEHLVLVAVSTAVALAIALPLGIALARRPRAARAVIGVANVVQTIPSLALFGFLIPLPFLGGIGARTAIVALVLYAILPVLTNTFAGIRGIPAPIVEAATGMGMTPRQILRWVELPLAAPVIIAGIRIATVISVGVATIAAAIGAGGLGTLIFRGVSMVDNRLVLAGAIPAAMLAVGADLLLTWIERRIQPGRRTTSPSSRA